ncbi:hypothetical protein GQ607_003638 [Colletotrichum asianum]|uniref:Uncharacterized protein n=1 Tax=Colletotrichum asianum TaxID=702518 RepID=A0A8H3WLX2_9PEZI|nr:hypothetical protein GQ607_003638 [Colletotrichum asianum]
MHYKSACRDLTRHSRSFQQPLNTRCCSTAPHFACTHLSRFSRSAHPLCCRPHRDSSASRRVHRGTSDLLRLCPPHSLSAIRVPSLGNSLPHASSAFHGTKKNLGASEETIFPRRHFRRINNTRSDHQTHRLQVQTSLKF